MAHAAFLVDWCYPNPKLPDGKELCDLLVVFGETAIIWQIKDLKLGPDGKYKKGDVEKNLRQVAGARRQLFDLKTPIELENPRRGKEFFDPSTIRSIHLISALVGPGEEFFSFIEEIKQHTVHVFSRDFAELVLNELDTTDDFCEYLRAKEVAVSELPRLIIMGGEKELLGFYLQNNRSFSRLSSPDGKGKLNIAIVEEGIWDQFNSQPAVAARNKSNRNSYLWDKLINSAHECGPEYEPVARELAKPNRFSRRVLSDAFYEAAEKAAAEPGGKLFRRVVDLNGMTYVVVFTDPSIDREQRRAELGTACFVARGIRRSNKRVLGIATEKGFDAERSFDFCLIDLPEWLPKHEVAFQTARTEHGVFTEVNERQVHSSEYPAPEEPK